MKKRTNPKTRAHLIRGAFYLLLLATVGAIPLALSQRQPRGQRTLTFAERVAYQRVIEEVYWRHRVWPEERPDPKPSLDAVISQAQLEKKVADYLRNSQALQVNWQRPISAEQLQAEMDRMALHTKQPEVLRELFEALGNDPFVIAECLARPALAERLLTNWSSHNQRTYGASKQQRVKAYLPANPTVEPASVAHLSELLQSWQAGTLIIPGALRTKYRLPADIVNPVAGGRYNPDTDT